MAKFRKRYGRGYNWDPFKTSRQHPRKRFDSLPLEPARIFECPETNEEITLYHCTECELYQEWGGSAFKRCRYEYEEYLTILEENERQRQKELEEEKQMIERLAEQDRKRQEKEQKLLELENQLNNIPEDEFDKRSEIFDEIEKIKWFHGQRPDLKCGFETDGCENTATGFDETRFETDMSAEYETDDDMGFD